MAFHENDAPYQRDKFIPSCCSDEWNSLLLQNTAIFSPSCIWIKQFAHVWASPDDAVILFVRKHDGNSKNLSRQGLHIKFALQYRDRR